MASVFTVLMMARSSTIFAVCGSSSLTQAPDCPCCWNLKMERATGKALCPEVMPVMRWPMRTLPGSSVPESLSSDGL